VRALKKKTHNKNMLGNMPCTAQLAAAVMLQH